MINGDMKIIGEEKDSEDGRRNGVEKGARGKIVVKLENRSFRRITESGCVAEPILSCS